MSLYSDFPFNL